MNSLNTDRYPDTEDNTGKITSTIGLKFWSPENFINWKAHIVCVSNVEGHIDRRAKDLFLDPTTASNGAYISQGSVGKFIFHKSHWVSLYLKRFGG